MQEVHQGEDRAAETELPVPVGPLAYRGEDDGRTDADKYDDQQRHQQGSDLFQAERAPCGVNGPGGLPPGLGGVKSISDGPIIAGQSVTRCGSYAGWPALACGSCPPAGCVNGGGFWMRRVAILVVNRCVGWPSSRSADSS